MRNLENGTNLRKRRELPVSVCFRLRRENILSGAVFLAAAVAVIWLCPFLFCGRDSTGQLLVYEGFTGIYAGLSLLGVLLCFLEVKMPEPAGRAVGWALVLLAPLGAFFAVDLINGTRILTFSFQRSFANYLCYLMVFALFYALFRRAWAAVLAGGLTFLLFGIINYFVVQFRGVPILPLDLQSVGTAATVSGGYQFTPTQPMILALLGLACTVLLCLKTGSRGKGNASRRFRLAERLSALGLAALLALLIFPVNLLSSLGISVWPWNQKTSSEITGVLAGFFGNVQFMMVEKPEDYSAGKVEDLGREAAALEEPAPLGDPGESPTIVVVMNESMTDFLSMGNVEFTQDNLPFLHSLQDSGHVIWGTAYSSVYGGNTCNSEYEFLTGNTTAFLPSGSIPYQQYVTREQTALPSILKSYGYSCTAIHPGNAKAWQRNTAYPYLGFDEFIAARDFDVERELVHGLTSDASCYDQVIYEYEHRDKSVPQFLFTVTIQNHGGYEDEDVPVTVRLKRPELDGVSVEQAVYPQTEQYLSLTKLSDQALEDLIGYFEKQKDPVVVLFFGDHWPSLENEFFAELLGQDAEDWSFEALMRKYQVPFLLWANYPLQSRHIENVSLNYLSGLLLQAADLEGTPYTKFLENLREQIPVVTAIGGMDREGNLYKNGDDAPYSGLLNEYAILQYNNSFDPDEKAEEFFTR